MTREAYRNARLTSASALGYVEAVSALARGRNAGRISIAEFEKALDDLEGLWVEIDVHAATSEVIEGAAQVVIDHGLRAYDSLHLATAVAIAKVEHITFACWDRELWEAAQSRGLALVPERL